VKHPTGEPTKAEAARFDDFRLVGCIPCYMLGYPETPYDVHHFLDGGKRIGHFASAPICPAHHRGVGFVQHLHVASIATNQSEFREVFGTDYEVWCLTDVLIKVKRRQRGLPDRPRTLDANEVNCG
jgi:hypothetical protein